MTLIKVLQVARRYRKKFVEFGIEAKPHSYDILMTDDAAALAHCHYMVEQMEQFAGDEDKIGKAFRWIGFIQGVVCRCGLYTIAEVKNHNRPTIRKRRTKVKKKSG